MIDLALQTRCPIKPSPGYVVCIRDTVKLDGPTQWASEVPLGLGPDGTQGTANGALILPDAIKDELLLPTCTVLAVGPETLGRDGVPLPQRCKVGDCIVTPQKGSGFCELELDSTTYELLPFEMVIGVIEED